MVKTVKIDIKKWRAHFLARRSWHVQQEFDTFKRSKGRKDVCLVSAGVRQGAVQRADHKYILRIGETRPKKFFPSGFVGKQFIIPRIFESRLHRSNHPAYEVEEYLPGKILSEREVRRDGTITHLTAQKLLAAFWEFQEVGRTASARLQYKPSHLLEHWQRAQKLMVNPQSAWAIITKHRDFWSGTYPAKWKFSLDNLIWTPNAKIGFIDNSQVGLRFFGYDLGWLIWPQWLTMMPKYYQKVNAHLRYLEQFEKLVQQTTPRDQRRNNHENFFWLVIFSRVIGALYDVVNNTPHLKTWQLGSDGNIIKTKQHVGFLNSLLVVLAKKVA